MKRFVVIVLDGFGIGAMEDVQELRPQDTGANTALHIYGALPGFRLPVLESLGLGNALQAAGPSGVLEQAAQTAVFPAGFAPGPAPVKTCCFGFHRLAHFGADTFWGHQELMGTRPLKGESGPIGPRLFAIREALARAGHEARFYGGTRPCFREPGAAMESGAAAEPGVLVVDGALTIGDNLETDLGDNYNVTAALDIMPFEKVREIGAIVRSLVHNSRVIVFGGRGVTLNDILNAYESSGPFAGVSAPRSGVYRRGYQVVHLGYGVKSEVQVPAMLNKAGIATVLMGKVADIEENPGDRNIPGVDTGELLEKTAAMQYEIYRAYICVNIHETDQYL
ncbi:MAG: phosphopentomutase, partial [Treponema sp.]|nr:phosphopentomutase [Treponema sp.]